MLDFCAPLSHFHVNHPIFNRRMDAFGFCFFSIGLVSNLRTHGFNPFPFSMPLISFSLSCFFCKIVCPFLLLACIGGGLGERRHSGGSGKRSCWAVAS